MTAQRTTRTGRISYGASALRKTPRELHEEALRIARMHLAARCADAVPVTEIYHDRDPGPDFIPRPWS